MALKRMTKTQVPVSFGAFKPVGHVVVAFPDDQAAQQAARDLRDLGLGPEDILFYTGDEEGREMRELLDGVSGTAEFGHEIVLMRRYAELAREGCGWLIVFAPEDEQAMRVAEVARHHGARMAERYHRLVVEDML
ncbi:hypothetical protein [Azohydromonas caseinilytica]|uniref:Uncharacterized protein n=1 Tax=Azohydromonas caseinilytica TaxID=2728836 RepID=A0A848FIX3_9BURK|nr:hypothetical protein [Azohydromonas caseinilytica]NML19192.1 hypothetical protein [Azohydromonas caseinilytica]